MHNIYNLLPNWKILIVYNSNFIEAIMNKLKDLKLKNQLIISTYIMLFILLIFKPTLIPSIYNELIIAFKPFIIGGLIAF